MFSQLMIIPDIQFLKDSVQVGAHVELSMSVTYDKSLDILLPDSLYDFSPFEFVDKRYFPTVSTTTSPIPTHQ